MPIKTIKISQQAVAERILEILVQDLSLKPGDVMPDQKLKERYRARNGDSADIKAGLEYAHEREWLSYEAKTQNWHLTQQGYEYA